MRPSGTVSDFLHKLQSDQSLDEDPWVAISQFADAFRDARPDERQEMIRLPPPPLPPWDALFASMVEELCDEVPMAYPAWTAGAVCPTPYYLWPVVTEEIKPLLVRMSKPQYVRHNVFTPGNLLSRARQYRS